MYYLTLSDKQKNVLTTIFNLITDIKNNKEESLFKDKSESNSGNHFIVKKILKNSFSFRELPKKDILTLVSLINTKGPFTISKEDALIIKKSSEFYARLSYNQFDVLMDFNYDWEDRKLLEGVLNNSCDVDKKDAYIAWDIYQVIRYRISWDEVGNPPKRQWPEMMTVNFDEPFKRGSEDLARFKLVNTKPEVKPDFK